MLCLCGTPIHADTVAWIPCEQISYSIQITVRQSFLKIGFILTCKVTSSCILQAYTGTQLVKSNRQIVVLFLMLGERKLVCEKGRNMLIVREGRSIKNELVAESRYLGEDMGTDWFLPGLS